MLHQWSNVVCRKMPSTRNITKLDEDKVTEKCKDLFGTVPFQAEIDTWWKRLSCTLQLGTRLDLFEGMRHHLLGLNANYLESMTKPVTTPVVNAAPISNDAVSQQVKQCKTEWFFDIIYTLTYKQVENWFSTAISEDDAVTSTADSYWRFFQRMLLCAPHQPSLPSVR